MRDIGKNIKRARIDRKMTQDVLAEKIHTTRQTVSNYENGKSKPDIDMLLAVADALNIDVTGLIYGNTDTCGRSTQFGRLIISGIAAVLSITTYFILYPYALRSFQLGQGGHWMALVFLLRLVFCVLCGYCIGKAVLIFMLKRNTSIIRSRIFARSIRVLPMICLIIYCLGVFLPPLRFACGTVYNLIIDGRLMFLTLMLIANGLLISLS